MKPLGRAFLERDVLSVAPDLVGAVISHGPVRLRVTEVEAYRWPGDTACHAKNGRTPRTAPLWERGGTLYVYLCYGLHQMLNIVTGPEGEAQAVLVRAAEVLDGLEIVRQRRGGREGPALLTGPGKVGQALAVDTSMSGRDLVEGGDLGLFTGDPPKVMAVGPRIGIDYAEPAHRDLPWRFADASSAWVSHRKKLARC